MAKKKSKPSRKGQKNNHYQPCPKASGANAEPARSGLDRSWSREVRDEGGAEDQDDQNRLAQPESVIEDSRLQDLSTLLPPHPDSIVNLPASIQDHFKTVLSLQNAATVTNPQDDAKVQHMMNANGTHPPNRPQQPYFQRDRRNHANDVAPSINTASTGLVRSHIQVAKPYVFYQAIEGCLHDLGVTQAREDNIRLAGVKWIDDVRRALKLYVSQSSRHTDVRISAM